MSDWDGEDFWQDREIRFDSPIRYNVHHFLEIQTLIDTKLSDLQCVRGEFDIDQIESVEDTKGKGHISLVTSATPFDGLIVRLE